MPPPQTQAEASSEEIDVEADLQDDDADVVEQVGSRRGIRPQSISDLPARSERLVVTSQLHPFWSTKMGAAVAVLVVLMVIGGIVGGVLGGRSNDEPARNPGSAPPTSSSMAVSSPASSSQISTTDTELLLITAAEVIPTSIPFSSPFSSLRYPPALNVLRAAEGPILS